MEEENKLQENKFSSELITSSGNWWEQAVNHRFFLEIKKGDLEEGVFKKYLRIEYNFLDTAARATGYAIAKAPDLKVKHRLANNVIDLATSQREYFHKAAANLNFELEEEVSEAVQKEARGLSEHFLKVSSSYGFAEILACMLGAELLYLTACSKIISKKQLENIVIREWIEMHTGGDFKENVKNMESELEKCTAEIDSEREALLKSIFQQTLKAEIDFHNAPYRS